MPQRAVQQCGTKAAGQLKAHTQRIVSGRYSRMGYTFAVVDHIPYGRPYTGSQPDSFRTESFGRNRAE